MGETMQVGEPQVSSLHFCIKFCCVPKTTLKLSLLKLCFNIIIKIKYTYHKAPEKAMATHSSTLAWKIPWAEEPGRLQSMGSQSRTRLSNFTFTFHFHALEKEMATHSSVLAWIIPATVELVGCRLWGRIESDTTEMT